MSSSCRLYSRVLYQHWDKIFLFLCHAESPTVAAQWDTGFSYKTDIVRYFWTGKLLILRKIFSFSLVVSLNSECLWPASHISVFETQDYLCAQLKEPCSRSAQYFAAHLGCFRSHLSSLKISWWAATRLRGASGCILSPAPAVHMKKAVVFCKTRGCKNFEF